MRAWIDLFEARMDRPWSKDTITAISDNAQPRFETLKSSLHVMGEIEDYKGQVFKIWGDDDGRFARFYAGNLKDKCVGYIKLDALGLGDRMMHVSMVFVLPKFQRRGIASKLYRFALDQGIEIVSDDTLTKGSRAIWADMMKDPSIEVTYFAYDRFGHKQPQEKPLTNIRQAFDATDHRMVARKKTLREYREEGLGTFTHDEHRYNLNKLFKLSEDLPIDQFAVADLKWVLKYDEPDPERVAAADVTVPVLITLEGNDVPDDERLVVVDGLHRLARAVEEGLEYLPGRMVAHSMLKQCDLTVLIRGIRKRLHAIHESYDDGDYGDEQEQDIEKESNIIIKMIKTFARKLPIRIEMRLYMNRYGGDCQGIVLTDLYADTPGNGAGTQVMNRLCQLADEYGISIYTDAEGPRSKAFYEKFGFERSSHSGHMLQRHPPLPAWFTDPD